MRPLQNPPDCGARSIAPRSNPIQRFAGVSLYKSGVCGVYSMETAGNEPMKSAIKPLLATALVAALFTSGCAKKQPASKNPEVAAQLKAFVAEKEAQESKLVKADENDFARYPNDGSKLALPDCQPFFAAAAKGDWHTVSNLWSEMDMRALGRTNATSRYPRGMWLQPGRETFGAVEAFAVGGGKYSKAFGDGIIESIPPGSIYFGGTDPGRFIITAMCKSQANGDPFFTLTQNALADGTYLNYLRSMYADRIYIPTAGDSQKSFQDYLAAAQVRSKENKLKPGENIKVTDGRVQVSGQTAVMEINGLLVKTIFEKNPDREFYIEESFPLDWMYPYLEPHGLIMKINRQPLPVLSDEIVQRDHDYWTKTVTPMIGDWLKPDTSISKIAAFAEKVFARRDFGGFTGDPQFVQNTYSHKMFSKERSSIAGLYAWRAQHATDAAEKKRMNAEADFAFRQAWALCPYSPEAVIRYVNLLMSESRFSDALLIAETAAKMPEMKGSGGEQMRGLTEQLQQILQQTHGSK
jgi:hypothetical protein